MYLAKDYILFAAMIWISIGGIKSLEYFRAFSIVTKDFSIEYIIAYYSQPVDVKYI